VAALSVVFEARFSDLLTPPADGRFEASGVTLKGTSALVVFDNTRDVAEVPTRLGGRRARWIRLPGRGTGFEDIAYSQAAKRHYLLVEAVRVRKRTLAMIEEYDERWRLLQSTPIDWALERRNKGFEALAAWGRQLFAMPERGASRNPSVMVLTHAGHEWRVVARMPLPRRAFFGDYSGLAVRGTRIAVLSQEDGCLWVGTFDPRRWRIVGSGRRYDSPRTKKGNRQYCNLEGVAWLSPDRVVVVSDRAKRGSQEKRCRKHDQSIHVFRTGRH
jgi:hypothetical protein